MMPNDDEAKRNFLKRGENTRKKLSALWTVLGQDKRSIEKRRTALPDGRLRWTWCVVRPLGDERESFGYKSGRLFAIDKPTFVVYFIETPTTPHRTNYS